MNLLKRIKRPLSSVLNLSLRSYSVSNSTSENKSNNTDTEKKLVDILRKRFSCDSQIRVADVSGGCGAMFDVTVISPEFKGISIVKQHRMVTEALKEEIKEMHGLRISTHHECISNLDT